jgi:signal transduction histidine kinase
VKLRTKLTLVFLSLSIFPLAIVGFFAYDNSRQVIDKYTYNHLISTNYLKENEFERWIDNNKRQLQELAQHPLVQDYSIILSSQDPASAAYQTASTNLIDNHLSPALEFDGGFLDLSILSPQDGQILISSDLTLVGKYRDSERFYLEGQQHTYVGKVAFSISHGQSIMHLSTPIEDDHGNLIGVLIGHADLGEMSKIIEELSGVSQSEDTYLVNNFNYFVTEPRFGDNYALKKAIRTDGVQACLERSDGVGYYDDYRGVQVIGAYHWMPERELCILTEVDQEEAFASVVTLRNSIIGMSVIVGLFVVLISTYLANSITKPINKLVEGASAISRAELEFRIETEAQDEIGQLSRSFNDMAASLEGSLERNVQLYLEVQQHAEALEEEVAERTQDLIGAQMAALNMMEDAQESRLETEQININLERSNEELQRFAYVASHDLQEPLRMIASYLQLLERRYKGKLDSDADEFINYAVNGANRMKTLINDLLAYSRVESRGEIFTQLNCDEIISNVLANLKVSIQENNAIITYDDLPEIVGDKTQIHQLFQNLVSNAIKFRKKEDPKIFVGVEEKENSWKFTVQDNGIGIDSQYFDRLFIIFQRLHTKEEYEGTGIGLAISKRIVERHGGRIWIESKLGEGSSIYFTIPKEKEL